MPNPAGERAPEWLRSAALDEDGRVYVPAATGGDERAVVLAACFDDRPLILDRGHAFVPADWLARECPAIADLCELIARKVRSLFGA